VRGRFYLDKNNAWCKCCKLRNICMNTRNCLLTKLGLIKDEI